MPTQPAPIAVSRAALRRPPLAEAGRVVLAVATIGHLVPRSGFAGSVHSTFAQACNVACGDALLTLVTPRAGNGPTSLVLAADAKADLRRLFDAGEAIVCRDGIARTGRVEIDFARAQVWRSAPRGAAWPELLHARLPRLARWLAQQRRDRHSVIDGAAAPATAALIASCRALDAVQATRHAARLVGWGEGLTPAGDDFLVGLLAGLDAMERGAAARAACRAAIVDAVTASLPRTTRISAHHLRLAAHGHYSERVLAARDTLLSDAAWPEVDAAWHAACAVGATSGADALAGLLAAVGAWLPEHTVARAA